jgi:hypothetical protein|tara:strand:- start:47 stop:241 length:195 start_codon:yes stop_codon:yes gene_type:complete
LRIIKVPIIKKTEGERVSSNDLLMSDPIKDVSIPSQFSDTCEELECLDDVLQLCFGEGKDRKEK